MAHIRSGSIVSDIRGKVGTEIYSRNRGGAYVKAFTSPVQPNTAAQVTRRDDLADCVTAWQGLTDDERSQWNVIASRSAHKQVLGSGKRRTGYNEFVARKLNLLKKGTTGNPTPVNTWKGPQMFLNAVEIFGTGPFGLRTDITVDDNDADLTILAWASDVVSAGVTSVNSVSLRFLGNVSFSSGLTGWQTDWQSIYGTLNPSSGQKIVMKVRAMVEVVRNPNGDFLGEGGQFVSPEEWGIAVAP